MTWENTTFVGSAYEEQCNPTTKQLRHRPRAMSMRLGQAEQPWRPGPAPDRPVGRLGGKTHRIILDALAHAERGLTVLFVVDRATDGFRHARRILENSGKPYTATQMSNILTIGAGRVIVVDQRMDPSWYAGTTNVMIVLDHDVNDDLRHGWKMQAKQRRWQCEQ